jgi:hypothetical protein
MDRKTYNALVQKAQAQLGFLLDKHSGEAINAFNDALDDNEGQDLTFNIGSGVKFIKEGPEYKSDVKITISNPIKDNAGAVAVNPDQPELGMGDGDDGQEAE